MKAVLLVLLGLVLAIPQALAQGTCVEVEIGGEKTPNLSCLNQLLQKQVESVQATGNVAPLDASSPAIKLGGYNETALKQQYGPNYGKSVIPWRPTATYGNRLH
jgi:hypothetical protein